MADTWNEVLIFGRDQDITLTIRVDGAARNITLDVLYFTIKESKDDADTDKLLYKTTAQATEIAKTTPLEGIATLKIARGDFFTDSAIKIAPGLTYYWGLDIKRMPEDRFEPLDHGKVTVEKVVLQQIPS